MPQAGRAGYSAQTPEFRGYLDAFAAGVKALNVLLGAPAPSADQLGSWYRPLLLLPEVLLDAPLGEETGWRGYALPLLPAGNLALASSLVLSGCSLPSGTCRSP